MQCFQIKPSPTRDTLFAMALMDEEYTRLLQDEAERAGRSRSPRGSNAFTEEDEGTWIELGGHGWCMVWYSHVWKPTKFEWTYKKGWLPSWWKKPSS